MSDQPAKTGINDDAPTRTGDSHASVDPPEDRRPQAPAIPPLTSSDDGEGKPDASPGDTRDRDEP